MFERLIQHYPVLHELAMDDVQAALRSEAQLVHAPAGTVLFEEGQPCKGFPMVLARRRARGPRLAWRAHPGALPRDPGRAVRGLHVLPVRPGAAVRPWPHHGSPTELVLLSPLALPAGCSMNRSGAIVFGIFADRLADLMALAEAVAFQRLDQRLAQALLGHGNGAPRTRPWPTSWARCARSSPACSSALNARAGWACRRERIDVLDGNALRALAAGELPPPTAGAV
jgi:CRP/FNR family transcriptional regulator